MADLKVFISYSSRDKAWAEKLEAGLRARGVIDVFRDQTGLSPGVPWTQALHDALLDSQHLILLWSDDHASHSDWVKREAAVFQAYTHVDFREGRARGRKMLQVCLQGRNKDYSDWQSIDDVDAANAYGDGAANVDPNVWIRVLEKIIRAIDHDDTWPRVKQVILASTREDMVAVPDGHKPTQRADTFSELLGKLGIQSKQELLARYGDQRSQWRPFGGPRTVVTMLAELQAELIERGGPKFFWQPVGEILWTGGPNELERIVETLCTEPCVILIDPLSLYDTQVFEQYQRLLECLANENAAIMVLPPFCAAQRDYLRDILAVAAERLFLQHYRPKFQEGKLPKANSSVITADDYEIYRLLANTVRPFAAKNKKHRALRHR